MILATHIIIALSSVGYTTYLYFRPNEDKFGPAYLLLVMTIASGTALILLTGANILKTCLTGLAFIGATSFMIALAKRKLAKEPRDI